MVIQEFFNRFYSGVNDRADNLFTVDQMLLFADSFKRLECNALAHEVKQLKRNINTRHILNPNPKLYPGKIKRNKLKQEIRNLINAREKERKNLKL